VKGLTSFGEDSCGRLYATSSSGGVGVVYRLVGAAPTVCPVATTTGPVATPIAKAQRAASEIRLRARERAVPPGKRAYLTATVSPCRGRQGEPVRLRVGKRTVARQQLGRTCKAHFRPRVGHPIRFRVAIAADATYNGATSDRLGLRPAEAAPAKPGKKSAKGGSGRA
jgi:hypothetical protein